MALRLVNTSPGIITDPIRPGQNLYMGLKSETLQVQLASTTVEIGLTSLMHGGVLPEDDPHLEEIGVTTQLETSERRRPIDGTVTKAIVGSSLVLTKTSNDDGDLGIYELQIPITPASPILAYFKFRKKTAWTPYNPDWCNLTDIIGMYFGVEHGTFNTAAYAFLRDDGATGSIVFAGPLDSYGSARSGQVELATDLDPVTGGTQGWMGLADDAVLEVFIRFNTFVSPYRVELWTRIAGVSAPTLQGSIVLGALGTFPNTTFTNSRTSTSDTATIFFGNIGQNGDILQLDDWALFPDYRTAIKDGEPTPFHERLVVPDAPIMFKSSEAKLPTEVDTALWFADTGAFSIAPEPSFTYQPGSRSVPIYLSMAKSGTGYMLLKREEPRLENLSEGFMIEAFLAGTSTSRQGDLVGPGFIVEDGSNAFKVLMLETLLAKNYGIAAVDATFTDATTYYTPVAETDFRSLKLVRLTVDRIRSRVQLSIDEVEVLDLPISTPALITNSYAQVVPTTALTGTSVSISISIDGGTSWSAPRTHAFAAEFATVALLVAEMNADAVFIGAGPTAFEVIDMGSDIGFRTTGTGSLLGIRMDACTAAAIGALAFDAPMESFGDETSFPASSDAIGKVAFGHPYIGSYEAELKLNFLNYLNKYLAWETVDSLTPDSIALDPLIQFTLDSSGTGSSEISSSELGIFKTNYASSATKRFYYLAQDFSEVGGIQVDFGATLTEYTNDLGQVNAPNTAIDAGLTLYLGNKAIYLRFFDCGILGRKLGIIPGSGTEDDITNQTPLGIAFSAGVDWTVPNRYRIVVRAFQAIEVWSGTVAQEPIITIPWRNDTIGFDLPADLTATGLAFGHFNIFTDPSSSATEWTYVRWGHSDGYEMNVQQTYPEGLPKYLFDGKAFILSDFDEA